MLGRLRKWMRRQKGKQLSKIDGPTGTNLTSGTGQKKGMSWGNKKQVVPVYGDDVKQMYETKLAELQQLVVACQLKRLFTADSWYKSKIPWKKHLEELAGLATAYAKIRIEVESKKLLSEKDMGSLTAGHNLSD